MPRLDRFVEKRLRSKILGNEFFELDAGNAARHRAGIKNSRYSPDQGASLLFSMTYLGFGCGGRI
jgi:hypothetical protein